jgi:hypothetical protein
MFTLFQPQDRKRNCEFRSKKPNKLKNGEITTTVVKLELLLARLHPSQLPYQGRLLPIFFRCCAKKYWVQINGKR